MCWDVLSFLVIRPPSLGQSQGAMYTGLALMGLALMSLGSHEFGVIR